MFQHCNRYTQMHLMCTAQAPTGTDTTFLSFWTIKCSLKTTNTLLLLHLLPKILDKFSVTNKLFIVGAPNATMFHNIYYYHVHQLLCRDHHFSQFFFLFYLYTYSGLYLLKFNNIVNWIYKQKIYLHWLNYELGIKIK